MIDHETGVKLAICINLGAISVRGWADTQPVLAAVDIEVQGSWLHWDTWMRKTYTKNWAEQIIRVRLARKLFRVWLDKFSGYADFDLFAS